MKAFIAKEWQDEVLAQLDEEQASFLGEDGLIMLSIMVAAQMNAYQIMASAVESFVGFAKDMGDGDNEAIPTDLMKEIGGFSGPQKEAFNRGLELAGACVIPGGYVAAFNLEKSVERNYAFLKVAYANMNNSQKGKKTIH